MLQEGDYIFEVSLGSDKPSIILYEVNNYYSPTTYVGIEFEWMFASYASSKLSGDLILNSGYLRIASGVGGEVVLIWSDF
jgi:hypothetical protein